MEKVTVANMVFLLAGRKFLSSRFSLIVLFVIFTKACYKSPRQQKYPTVSGNILKMKNTDEIIDELKDLCAEFSQRLVGTNQF